MTNFQSQLATISERIVSDTVTIQHTARRIDGQSPRTEKGMPRAYYWRASIRHEYTLEGIASDIGCTISKVRNVSCGQVSAMARKGNLVRIATTETDPVYRNYLRVHLSGSSVQSGDYIIGIRRQDGSIPYCTDILWRCVRTGRGNVGKAKDKTTAIENLKALQADIFGSLLA